MWEGWGDESCSTQQPQTLNTRDTRMVRTVAFITSVLVILNYSWQDNGLHGD